jgi:hypothetical protein
MEHKNGSFFPFLAIKEFREKYLDYLLYHLLEGDERFLDVIIIYL